jgi:hypothetical protein
VILIVAERAPAACGVNLAETLQLCPAVKCPLQLFESGAQSPLSAPNTPIPLKVRVTLPVFVTVTDWTALVVPSVWFPKLKEVVERLAV